MAYQANVRGGILGSGELGPSAPQIDIAGGINALASAFRNNREDVLNRAIQTHRIAMEQHAQDRADQEQEMQMRAQGWRPPEEMTPSPAAPAAPQQQVTPSAPLQVGAPETPSAPIQPPPVDSSLQGAPGAVLAPGGMTSGSDGKPQFAQPLPAPGAGAGVTQPKPVTFGGSSRFSTWQQGLPANVERDMGLRRNALTVMSQSSPGLFTPAEIEMGAMDPRAFDQLVARKDKVTQAKAEEDDRYSGLEGVTGADGKPLSDTMRRAIAKDPQLYRKTLDLQLNPPEDKFALHARERAFDQSHPLRDAGSAVDNKNDARADSYVTHRIEQLTAMQPAKFPGGPKQPGMDYDSALKQAVAEAGKRWGNDVVSRLYPDHGTPKSPDTGGKGDIDLRSKVPQEAIQEHEALAAKYQHALTLPGVDPKAALKAYSDDNAALKKKYGIQD